MQDWEVQLARMFKARDPKKPDGITKGIVVSPLPNLRVSIGSEIILDTEQLVISTTIHGLNPKSGTEIILMPTANGQKYFALDGVGAIVSNN